MPTTASEPLTAESFVTLRGGLTVRVAAIRLLLDLEARGVKLETDGGDILIHRGSQVTEDDRQALRQFKHHVVALLNYAERVQ